MEESRVRYSKLSMITATNRLSIWTKRTGTDKNAAEIHWQAHMPLVSYCPDQEGAEEDEGDEVAVGEVGATASFMVRRHGERGDGGVWLTLLTWQARKHNLLPGLPRSAPAKSWTWSLVADISWNHPQMEEVKCVPGQTHLKSNIRALKKVLKLLCWLMWLSSFSLMFPNTCTNTPGRQNRLKALVYFNTWSLSILENCH